MSTLFAIVAAVAVINPPRTRLGLPMGRARFHVVATGIAVGVAVLLVVAAVSESVLSGLEISPETFRIAAGFVLVIVAGWMLFFPAPTDEPELAGWGAAVWPVAYPRVVSPETLTFALTIGASEGVGTVAAGLAVGAGLLAASSIVPSGPLGDRVSAALGRLVAAVVVLVGIWLAIEGIREV